MLTFCKMNVFIFSSLIKVILSVGRWVGGLVGRWVDGLVGWWVGGSVGKWLVVRGSVVGG